MFFSLLKKNLSELKLISFFYFFVENSLLYFLGEFSAVDSLVNSLTPQEIDHIFINLVSQETDGNWNCFILQNAKTSVFGLHFLNCFLLLWVVSFYFSTTTKTFNYRKLDFPYLASGKYRLSNRLLKIHTCLCEKT